MNYPGDGKPKPVAFPDPVESREKKEDLWVIGLEKLIELKLASGLTAPHRLKDLADVQELTFHWSLPNASMEAFATNTRNFGVPPKPVARPRKTANDDELEIRRVRQ